nr:cytoplasmic protein [uncultured Brevundimonas sp.]
MSVLDPAAPLKQAHSYSSQHRKQLESSSLCGCFYCETNFEPARIEEWIDDEDTALCPNCGIDSVIGDASGVTVKDADFMRRMHNFWFER